MADELEDLDIDGESESPKPRRRVGAAATRKRPVARAVKRPAPARRQKAAYDLEEDEEKPRFHERPRISIEAATSSPRKVNLYRRLAMTFFCATVVVVIIIGFFTFQRANIVVHQESIPVAASFSVEIVGSSASSTATSTLSTDAVQFQGMVVAVTTSTETVYKPVTTIDKPGKAHGTITVYNNGSAPQPLIATTRFLSSGGVLFRLVNAVTVPAHGTISAEIAADKPGAAGDIAPGNFSIPGLNAAQQKNIYGVSTKDMMGGSGKVGIVTQADIDKAQEDARKALLEIGQRELTRVNAPQGNEVLYATVNIKAVSSAKANDQVSEYRVTASGTMAYVAYPKTAVFAAADREVQSKAPTPYHKVAFVNEAPTVSLQSIDVVKKTAVLQIYREGRAVLDMRSAALQPGMFMGQTSAQIIDQIKSIKGVTSVDVSLMPPWIDQAPKVPTRISVEIEAVK